MTNHVKVSSHMSLAEGPSPNPVTKKRRPSFQWEVPLPTVSYAIDPCLAMPRKCSRPRRAWMGIRMLSHVCRGMRFRSIHQLGLVIITLSVRWQSKIGVVAGRLLMMDARSATGEDSACQRAKCSRGNTNVCIV
jgi:hypothetical protein